MVKYFVRRGNDAKHLIIDIRREEAEYWQKSELLNNTTLQVGDYLTKQLKSTYDLMITNPPFSLAQAFVDHASTHVRRGGLIFILQRSNWIGTLKRSEWMKHSSGLWKVLVITKRPTWELRATGRKAKKNRSDTYEYFWFVFKVGYTGLPEVDWLFI